MKQLAVATFLLIVLVTTPLLADQRAKFHGKKLATRYQVAQIIARFLTKAGLKADRGEQDLSDVSSEYALSVSIATNSGAMQSMNGKFYGNRLINRYAMATILSRILNKFGHITSPAEESHFNDVPNGHWAVSAIELVTRLKLMKGYKSKFHGKKLLNRYQLAIVFALLSEQLNLKETEKAIDFSDVPKSHWAHDALQRLSRLGLIQSYDCVGAR